MITVQIPAAIRACSPVHMETPHGDMVRGIAIRLQPEDGTICVIDCDENIWNVPSALVSLIISGPTGAAHLAWWLRDLPARGRETCRADFAALGCDAQTLIGVIERASVAADCTRRDLELLRDYAHRVAGVTHG